MTSKEKYKQLCETEGARIPLFQQYWWMETVCEGKQWDVLLAEENGDIVGALPYLIGRRFGVRYILLPQLTQFNGPWYRNDDPDTRLRVGSKLEEQLHNLHVAVYLQHFSPDLSDPAPFTPDHGYRLSKRVTYRFDPIPAPDSLPILADRGRKRGLKAVDSVYFLDKNVSANEFADFHRQYWERRSGHDLLPQDFIVRVVQTALDRKQGLLFGLRDAKGRLMAARFVAFDDHCAYALLSARQPDALHNSMTRLVWEILTNLYGCTSVYDFEGSMDPGIAHFNRSFGAVETPFLEVSRFRSPLLRSAVNLIARITHR